MSFRHFFVSILLIFPDEQRPTTICVNHHLRDNIPVALTNRPFITSRMKDREKMPPQDDAPNLGLLCFMTPIRKTHSQIRHVAG